MKHRVWSSHGFRSRRRAMLAHGLWAIAAVPLASSAATPVGPLAFLTSVESGRPTVTLSEVADLTALPEALREQAKQLVVLAILPSASIAHVNAQRLAESARRQMPILAPWLTDVPAADIRITLRNTSKRDVPTAGRRSCVALLLDLDAGVAPAAGTLRATHCDGRENVRAWRYDAATHVARAARPLRAGEIVAAPARQRIASVRRGETVTQHIQIGASTVTRNGIALTDATDRRFTAVQTRNGETALWSAASAPRSQ